MLKELIGYNNLIKHKIEYRVFQKLQKFALKHLGLENMNQLRDRYEGQAYFDSFLTRSYAEIALQDHLQDNFIDLESKERQKNYKPSFNIKGENAELIYSNPNTYPLIPKGDYKYGALVFVNLTNRETFLLGFATKEEIIAKINILGLSPMLEQTNYGYLKEFDFFTPFGEKSD